MDYRNLMILGVFFALAVFFNSAQVYAENSKKPAVQKATPSRQKTNKAMEQSVRLSIEQMQNEIRSLTAAIQSSKSIHSSTGQTFSATGRVTEMQIGQLNQTAQDLLRKSNNFKKQWALSSNKFKIRDISKESQSMISKINRDIQSLVKSISDIVYVQVPIENNTTVADCLKKIKDSSICEPNCCDDTECMNCCINTQSSADIGICTARCMYKAALCVLSGVADRNADIVSTITNQ
ncbi:MAG: hypothetical protein KKG70_03880 [Proteobacteria bacterium]|nr:hypothetical protein [Pseudomonadota bacterium]